MKIRSKLFVKWRSCLRLGAWTWRRDELGEEAKGRRERGFARKRGKNERKRQGRTKRAEERGRKSESGKVKRETVERKRERAGEPGERGENESKGRRILGGKPKPEGRSGGESGRRGESVQQVFDIKSLSVSQVSTRCCESVFLLQCHAFKISHWNRIRKLSRSRFTSESSPRKSGKVNQLVEFQMWVIKIDLSNA